MFTTKAQFNKPSSARSPKNLVKGRTDDAASDATFSGAIGQIRLQAHSLSPSLRRVAEHVIQHADSAVHQTITEVATSVGVSEATITRLCRKLNYAGFHAFKIALAADLGGRKRQNLASQKGEGNK